MDLWSFGTRVQGSRAILLDQFNDRSLNYSDTIPWGFYASYSTTYPEAPL